MLHIFMTAVNAVFPIVLLILLGCWLRQKNFLNDSFLKTGNALVFKVCLPVMLFINVYEIDSLAQIPWGTVIYCIFGIALLFLVGMVIALLGTKEANRRGVLWQCIFRSNYAIIGLPLTFSTIAASRCVAPESYLKPVPGSRSILLCSIALTQSPAMSSRSASVWSAPRFIVSRSRTRTCRRFSDGFAGALSGKNDTTRRSRSILPSSTRKPIAVDVKLFECE